MLGLSYKPNTEVIEESQGVALAKHLLESGVRVVVYDPAAMDNARQQLGGGVTYATSAADCARQADVLAITTPWPEFRILDPVEFKRDSGMPVVLDCWRILPHERFEGLVHYLTLGSGTSGNAEGARKREQVLAAEGD